MRSYGKLITLHLQLQKTYGLQTRQGGDLTWQFLTLCYMNFISPNVRPRGKLKKISNFTRLMSNKLATVVTSGRSFRTQTPQSSQLLLKISATLIVSDLILSRHHSLLIVIILIEKFGLTTLQKLLPVMRSTFRER